MPNYDLTKGGASYFANPLSQGAAGLFGSSGHHTQMQSGADFSQMDPNDIALKLGTSGFTPSYDSNTKGSFESAYNNILNNLTPDQLIARYSKGTPNMFQTPLDQQQYQAYSTAKSILGRDINSQEFSQLLPAFQGPNGLANGRAYLSNMAQQEQSNPQNPNSPWNPNNANNKLAPFNATVTQQFQSLLGRAPTADELGHFSSMLGSNQTDAFGLSAFLKQMPEYTNQQDTQFRNGLNDQLAGYDQQTFDRMKGDVMGDFQQRGMGSSPSLDYALTDMMGQLAKQRGQYLAGISAQQYGGNKALAAGNYQDVLGNFQNQANLTRQQQMGYGSQLINQGFAGQDYLTQMRDTQNFMNANRGQYPNPMYGAIGGLAGAGLGFAGGQGFNPQLGGLGSSLGQSMGGAYGYLNRY